MSIDIIHSWYEKCIPKKPKDPPTPEEVITNGHQICKTFIGNKLKKLNLIKPDNVRSPNLKKHSFGILAYQGVNVISHFMLGPNSAAQATENFKTSCAEFQEIAVQLESMYPDLYKNVASQMGINVGWEQQKISEVFLQFSNELLCKSGESEPQIYWAKIISLLCIGAGLAVDCAKNGKWDTIPKIIDTFDRIVAQILMTWIISQNGWNIPPELKPDKFSRLKKYFLIFNTFLAIFAAILLVAWRFY
uniref:Bok-2 n=1 Tax=Schmidtea mediterranea TaxID=79327 RepID=H2DL18_SCHMD|nr:bok-2 [Schmidtea mediterranea]